jgi:tRNA-modifying protein YgfZ
MLYKFHNSQSLIVSGLHARRYLNSRSTNDISSLKVGSRIETAILNPQGKVEGIFWVLCLEDKRFLITIESIAAENSASTDYSLDSFISALTRYKVSERIDFTTLPAVKLIHSNSNTVTAKLGTEAESSSNNLYSVSMKRFTELGSDIIFSDDESFQKWDLLNPTQNICAEDLGYLRVLNNLPIFGLDYPTSILLPELPFFERLVSFKKGCYVGQEVVEKVCALGKPPRKLVRFTTAVRDKLLMGSVTEDLGSGEVKKVGEVVCSYLTPEQSQTGFALVKNLEFQKLSIGEVKVSLFE